MRWWSSAATNREASRLISAPCLVPTQSNLRFSGATEKRKDSPVPKYDRLRPRISEEERTTCFEKRLSAEEELRSSYWKSSINIEDATHLACSSGLSWRKCRRRKQLHLSRVEWRWVTKARSPQPVPVQGWVKKRAMSTYNKRDSLTPVHNEREEHGTAFHLLIESTEARSITIGGEQDRGFMYGEPKKRSWIRIPDRCLTTLRVLVRRTYDKK